MQSDNGLFLLLIKHNILSQIINNKINIALIGYGYWGINLARVIKNNPDCELIAIVDIDETKRNKAKQHYNSCLILKDLSEIFELNNITSIVIATPVSQHFPIVSECLKKNIHVLCEKVLSDKIEEIEELIALAEKHQVILDVDYTFLENSIVKEIKRILDTKQLGEINYMTFKRTGLGPIRSDVNVIYDLLAHDISILIYWIGIPHWVISTERCILKNQKADIAFIQLGFENNIIVNLHASWLCPLKQRQIEVVGVKGMLIFDDTTPSEKLKIIYTNSDYQSMATDFGSFQLSIKSGDIVIPNIIYPEPLKEKFNSFLAKIRNNKIDKNKNNETIKINSKVLEAIRLSAAQNSKKINI